MPRTKIVATIGPASSDENTMRALIRAGMNVARINFSHGDRESVTILAERLRRVAAGEGKLLAILGDLQGPKLRLGKVPNDGILLQHAQPVILSADPDDTDAIPFPHPELLDSIHPGARLVLGDGEVELTVQDRDGLRLYCLTTVEGEMKSRRGVNMPGTDLPIPSLTDKDRVDVETACDLQFDFLALSFVRRPEDIVELRALLHSYGSDIPIIAKIEKAEAIDALEAIRDVTDGMMVARGDLGLDLPAYEIPMLQKRIIRACNDVGKPVITATQMLQSMVDHPIPTRAEATDVANAILDGSDAVMLSAETAAGKYPVRSVQMMHNIAQITEHQFPYEEWEGRRFARVRTPVGNVSDAISSASCGIALRLGVKAIVTTTVSGFTAMQIARYRPPSRVIAVTPYEATSRRLCLVWGVEAIHIPQFASMDEMVDRTGEAVARTGEFEVGDMIVITAGVPFGRTGRTNVLQVHELTEEDFAGVY
jgi:pyruvate kinase